MGRASHGSAFDSPRNRVWIFGGYTTYYPYLRTDGQGSGMSIARLLPLTTPICTPSGFLPVSFSIVLMNVLIIPFHQAPE